MDASIPHFGKPECAQAPTERNDKGEMHVLRHSTTMYFSFDVRSARHLIVMAFRATIERDEVC